jgi:hypothetical protein
MAFWLNKEISNMKIISKPDIESWKLLFDCYQCKSKLEADSGDVKFYEERQYRSNSDIDDNGYIVGLYKVDCPVCNKAHSIHENDLPHLLKEKVKQDFLDTKYKKGK